MFSVKRKIHVLAGLILLLAGRSALPHEVCYAYDGLERLIAAMDPRGQAAIYKYDAVGNILAIDRDAASAPVDVMPMDPPGATPGSQVVLFGIGFSPTASENQVSNNGLAFTVLAVSRCTLTAEIPAGAVSGPVSITTPSGSATAPNPLSIFDIAIPVTTTAIVIGDSAQFTANIAGCSDPLVIWPVNGIVGGNALVGTVMADGLFTAPAWAPPAPGIVTIRAESVGCPGRFAEQTLTIVAEPNGPGAAAVSVQFGTPQTGLVPGTLTQAVSVAKAPVILDLGPDTAQPGTTFSLTATGANLAEVTAIEFFFEGAPDPAIDVTNLTTTDVRLTATVAITASAPAGPRLVVVRSPSASSTGAETARNTFTVTP